MQHEVKNPFAAILLITVHFLDEVSRNLLYFLLELSFNILSLDVVNPCFEMNDGLIQFHGFVILIAFQVYSIFMF